MTTPAKVHHHDGRRVRWTGGNPTGYAVPSCGGLPTNPTNHQTTDDESRVTCLRCRSVLAARKRREHAIDKSNGRA